MVVDITPLRADPGYRTLWSGQLGSAIGRESGRYVFPIQVYILTGSLSVLGLVAVAQLAATIVLSLTGGWLSDRHDRRLVILIATGLMAGASVGLLLLAGLEDPPLLAVLALGVTTTSAFTLEQPARGSATPRLVAPERLPAAVALNSLTFQTMAVAGPALAALMFGSTGLVGAYTVQVLGYGWAFVASLRLPPIAASGTSTGSPWTMLRDSWSFVRVRRIIQACFAVDLAAMIFALPMGSLLPVLLIEAYGVSAEVVGILLSARAAGAVTAAALSGWTRSVRSLGRLLLASVVVYAAVTIAIGILQAQLWLAVPLLAMAGAADVISVIARGVIIQTATPDDLRGRITALHVLASGGGPRVGDVRAAAMAEALGAAASITIGGVFALLAVAAVGRRHPELRGYRLPGV